MTSSMSILSSSNPSTVQAAAIELGGIGTWSTDWQVRSLGEIGDSLIGLTYNPIDVRTDGFLVLRSSNIVNNVLQFDDNVFVERKIPDHIFVREGDLLICVRNGSRSLI